MEYKDHSKKSSSSSRSHRKSKSRSRSPSTRSSGSSRSSRSRERRRTSRSRSRSHSRERSSRSRKHRDHGHKSSSRSSSRSSNDSDLEQPSEENADDYSQEYSQTTEDTPQSEQPSHDNNDDDQEEEESSLIQTHQSYSTKILASTNRLHQYTAENDRLLDEVSHLRLQILEMQNDRSELVRAHRESMSLLAQVSEEKLVEYKSKSEQEAAESKAAQEEALRTVLEMMEKDCEERVAELDRELARIDAERARAAEMQAEAARRALEEERTKEEYEEACRLAVEKLVQERQVRSVEMQQLSEREERLLRELEETKRRAEREKEAAAAAAAAALASEAMASASAGAGGDFGDDSRSGGSASYSQNSYDGSYDDSGGGLASSSVDSDPMSPLIPAGGNDHPGAGAPQDGLPKSKRPPVIDRRHAPNYRESIFLRDPPHEMTRGRRIALKLQNYSWYQPRGKGKNNKHWDVHGLGLQSAWAYFEHSVLPRYIVRNEDGSLPSLDGTEGQIGPGLSEDDQSEKQANVSVYEGSVGSSVYTPGGQDENDSVVDSDVSDWLYKPNPSNKNGQGGMNGLGPKRTRQSGDLTRADPGESKFPTRLYSPFFTPLSQLGDFGIGVGLYFSSLRGIALITLIAGCINLPNILYFAGEEYSASQPGVDFLLKGSAICTEQVWVPCPTCLVDDFDRAKERIAGTTTVTPDGQLQTLVFALKNACDGATMQVGIFNMASLGFVLLAVAILSLYQRRMQIKFDVQAQTAQDYSIVVFNPPADATEPEEWKEFFETRFGGHVTCCTVTKNNDLLVRALAERREILAIIEEKVKEGSLVNTLSLSELAARIEHGRHCFSNIKKRISPGIPELVGRLTVLNTKIQGLAQQQYNATRVFCTFETEASQRKVLQEMTVGSITAYKNKTHAVNTKLLFRGEHVLLIREAEEPSAIRWMDLDEKIRTRIKQISITTIISLACIFAVAVIVTTCRQISAAAAALAISISNALFPFIAKTVTNFESHASETGKQSSLFVKIAIFRWVITAIVITVIMPFTSTLTNGSEHLIQSIYIIFFADLVITNVLQILDPVSNFRRHFLAPRAGTQDRMNLLMGGTEYTIAERYTNMTKTLFLAFYYSAIYPSAFFMCFVNLFVSFFIDKFSLLRTWKPTPLLGPYIAKFSRIYFMTTAIAAMAITSSYFFAGFPYDNLCPEDVSHSAYYGTWQIINGDGEETIATIEPGERSYHFCNQLLGPGDNFAFPAFPDNQPPGSEWMTEEQERLTGIYAFVSVSVLGLLGLIFVYRMIRALQDLFSSKYKPQGADQGKNFSAKGNISSYVPQIQSDHFAHPLVAVNIDHIGENIFDWHDPDRSHSYYDLTRDAEKLLKGDEEICYRAFGQIRHWPPDGRNPAERAGDNGEDDFDGGAASVSGASQATTRSALRKNKDPNNKRNVSWSSKVTCKTYSKDDPNNYDFFNANASTTRGMNFDGHSDPLYDPHTQNEARVNKKVPPSDDPAQPDLFYGDGQGARAPDPYYNDGLGDQNYQSNVQDPRNQQGQAPRAQPTVAEQFDPYYNTGLDYQNQQPDQMYGGSQTRDESSERSYDQSSGASSSFNQSDDLSQPSDASSYSQVPSESSEQRSDYDDESEIYGNSSQGSSYVSDQHAGVESPETWQQNSYHSGSDASNQYGSQQDYGSQGSSQQDYGSQGSQQEYYDGEGFVEGEQNWDNDGESGSFSAEDVSSAGSSEGLPPVT